MNFSRQVKWGAHIEMGGTSLDGRRASDSEKFHPLLVPIIASMRETGMALLCKHWQEWEIF